MVKKFKVRYPDGNVMPQLAAAAAAVAAAANTTSAPANNASVTVLTKNTPNIISNNINVSS